MSTRQRNLDGGFANVRKFAAALDLPQKVINAARDLMALYDERKEKTMQGARSEEFAIAMLFIALKSHAMERSPKELAGLTERDEKTIRNHIMRIQKVLPNVTAKVTAPVNFIRTIVSEIGGPLILEKFAGEISELAMDHVCDASCSKQHITGKRSTTIAAACVLLAAKHLHVEVQAADVAASAMISPERAIEIQKLIQGHWTAMWSGTRGGSDGRIAELQELQAKTLAAVAPLEEAGEASLLPIKI